LTFELRISCCCGGRTGYVSSRENCARWIRQSGGGRRDFAETAFFSFSSTIAAVEALALRTTRGGTQRLCSAGKTRRLHRNGSGEEEGKERTEKKTTRATSGRYRGPRDASEGVEQAATLLLVRRQRQGRPRSPTVFRSRLRPLSRFTSLRWSSNRFCSARSRMADSQRGRATNTTMTSRQ